MLSLLDCTPEELRAIADHLENPHEFSGLLKVWIRPVIEWHDDGPDKLVGFERTESVIMDGDQIVGFLVN